MKDMGETFYILRVKIFRDHSRKLLSLSQEPYLKKILERFNMADCKLIDTPIAKVQSLNLDMCPKIPQENERMTRVPYVNVIGSLMYIMMCTMPNISYTVGLVSRFQLNPGQKHWSAIKRFWHILKALQIILYAIKEVVCKLLDIQMPTGVATWMSANRPQDMHSC